MLAFGGLAFVGLILWAYNEGVFHGWYYTVSDALRRLSIRISDSLPGHRKRKVKRILAEIYGLENKIAIFQFEIERSEYLIEQKEILLGRPPDVFADEQLDQKLQEDIQWKHRNIKLCQDHVQQLRGKIFDLKTKIARLDRDNFKKHFG